MGEVYRALDTRLDREVAIKVLPADRTASETQRWQFIQEARAASALNHPHIITIHEIESVDGVDFMVMECLPGTTLDALISRNGMAVHEVLRVAIPIADALAAAHEHGIVHSDLKPANVIVSRQGHVKVLDFGLARFVADGKGDEGPRTVTMPDGDQQVTAGTPPYMSPEQASGRELDARSDIFSFGAVLYEMTTGRRAFGRESLAETLAAVLKDDPRPPHELTPGLPDSLEGIILRCLKKDPARRFQHASDIKVQLEEVRSELGGEGTASERRPRYARMVLASIALFALVSAAAVVRSRSRGSVVPPPTVQQLTSERWAGAGSFSPDGSQIAYASAGDDGVNWDIRLKIVGETVARRLTTDPAGEGYPVLVTRWHTDRLPAVLLRDHEVAVSLCDRYGPRRFTARWHGPPGVGFSRDASTVLVARWSLACRVEGSIRQRAARRHLSPLGRDRRGPRGHFSSFAHLSFVAGVLARRERAGLRGVSRRRGDPVVSAPCPTARCRRSPLGVRSDPAGRADGRAGAHVGA